MTEIRLRREDLNMILVFFIVIIVILVVFCIHMMNGRDYYDSIRKPNFAPPPWLFMLLTTIVVLTIGYVAVIIWRYSGDDKPLCFSLWVAEVILLWGAFVAFFERQQPEVTAYLLMAFLAVHASLIYKLQHIDTLSATLYLASGVWMLYVILTVLEISNLN